MMIKRTLNALIAIAMIAVCIWPCLAEYTNEAAATSVPTVAENVQAAFSYLNDPRENPGAMEDIVENPEAVYGFSPNPDSKRLGEYAVYDWTDPAAVAEYRKAREAYHASIEGMYTLLRKLRDEGADIETMARALSEERNRIRLASYEGDPEGLAKVQKSNEETYGNPNGPTPDYLFAKYGSWETVLQKAFGTNAGMDACCGLYDEYYTLYVELGMIP